jgi:hypothetical protein
MSGIARKSARRILAATRLRRHGMLKPTRSAPLTDSSHKSIINSSSAMDSLSMLMRR